MTVGCSNSSKKKKCRRSGWSISSRSTAELVGSDCVLFVALKVRENIGSKAAVTGDEPR